MPLRRLCAYNLYTYTRQGSMFPWEHCFGGKARVFCDRGSCFCQPLIVFQIFNTRISLFRFYIPKHKLWFSEQPLMPNSVVLFNQSVLNIVSGGLAHSSEDIGPDAFGRLPFPFPLISVLLLAKTALDATNSLSMTILYWYLK